jgi:hypothetical protein
MSFLSSALHHLEGRVKQLQASGASKDEIIATISSQKEFKGFLLPLPSIIPVMFEAPADASLDTIMDNYIALTTPTTVPTTPPTPNPTPASTLQPCISVPNNTILEFPQSINATTIGTNIVSGIRIVDNTSSGAGSPIALGDIDNDGRKDTIIGATKANKIYVVKSNTLITSTFNLTKPETGEISGIVIDDIHARDSLQSVASGDINLDRYDDIAFTTSEYACVVFGGINLPQIIHFNDIVPYGLGICVSLITPKNVVLTDFNGDGLDDLIVPEADQINIFLGDSLLSNNSNLTDSLLIIKLVNDTSTYEFASAVGDLNTDSRQDLFVTLKDYSSAFIVFGIDTIAPSILELFDIGFGGDTNVALISGSAIESFIPASPSKNSGDFNGDGCADIAISDLGTQDIRIIYGPFMQNNIIDISDIGTEGNSQGVLFPGSDLFAPAPSAKSVSTFKNAEVIFSNLNNDNFADLIIAHSGHGGPEHQQGKVYIVPGHNNPDPGMSLLNNTLVTVIDGGYRGFGSSLAGGDVNCDSIPDLVVGAPFDSYDFGRRGINNPTPAPPDNVFIFFGE